MFHELQSHGGEVISTGQLRLYVDGQLRAQPPLSQGNSSIDYAINSLCWGAGFGPNSFDGLLGEARYYNTALSDSAILDLYNLRSACFSPMTSLLPELVAGGVTVYPNPAGEQVAIASASAVERLELYSVMGHLVRRKTGLDAERVLLDVGDLPAGTYLLRCWNGSGLHRVKLVVR